MVAPVDVSTVEVPANAYQVIPHAILVNFYMGRPLQRAHYVWPSAGCEAQQVSHSQLLTLKWYNDVVYDASPWKGPADR